jgi:pyruvate kinase
VHPPRRRDSFKPSIIVTVSSDTPILRGMDLIRLDAAHGTLAEISRTRASYSCPAMLDLPGPSSHARTSLLTTSEFLIFASAEGFDWVTLNGVREIREVQRARELLLPSIQLASAICELDELGDAQLGAIVAASDALVLRYGDLETRLGGDRARQQVGRALVACARQRRPLLLSGGLLSTMVDSRMPEISQLEWIGEFAHAGCAGFILTEETAASPHSQLCVDTLEFVLAPLAATVCRRQSGFARVAAAPGLFSGQAVAPAEDE